MALDESRVRPPREHFIRAASNLRFKITAAEGKRRFSERSLCGPNLLWAFVFPAWRFVCFGSLSLFFIKKTNSACDLRDCFLPGVCVYVWMVSKPQISVGHMCWIGLLLSLVLPFKHSQGFPGVQKHNVDMTALHNRHGNSLYGYPIHCYSKSDFGIL